MSVNSCEALWFGTDEARPTVTLLEAGALNAELVDGNLRAVRWQGTEVLRAIAYVVRDRDWGTYAPQFDDLQIEKQQDGFAVRYTATCKGAGDATLTYRAAITGAADGTLTFAVEASPDRDFETNRCGFCVLHPIVGLAGRPATVEHVDGTVEQAVFPDAIEPWQPFMAMRSIAHEVRPGLTATCRLDGDTFEMEDQRNWSDASYKTYVRPLALPWPYRLPAGVAQRQAVTLTLTGNRSGSPSPRSDETVTLRLDRPGGRMPRLGLVVTPEEADDVLRQAERLSEVAPQVLLLHFDPVAGHGAAALARLAAVQRRRPEAEAVLECVVPGRDDPRTELAATAALVRDAGLRLEAVAVSPSVDRQSTPPGSAWPDCPPLEEVYAAARAAFPALTLGGGMFSYFTELNRKRPPVDLLDFVTHCTCPIVHAADDGSVMQSLEALPFIVRSARAIMGDRPYRIGPSTIPMRQNPYGSRTFDNPGNGRLTMTHADPRQRGLFAAAWTVGYVAATAEGGLDVFTSGALTGAFGLMPAAPDGAVFPVFHVVKGLAALAGAERRLVVSEAPDRVLGFAADRAGVTTLWIANITDQTQTVSLPAGFAEACMFDHRSWPAAAHGGEPERTPCGRTLMLEPYAVARLQG